MVRKEIAYCLILFALAFAMSFAGAYSNDSINAQKAIDQAKTDIAEMQSRGIPVLRANESLNEAIQIYAAQIALEDKNKTADYKVVLTNTLTVVGIKDVAIKANDELKIFEQTYDQAKTDTNLSEMDDLYQSIITSFNEERFEDTLNLINDGYKQISEIQAKQTTLRVFYEATSKNIKQFFVNNWTLLISVNFYQSVYFYAIIFLVLLAIFWNAAKKVSVKLKIKHLVQQKSTLNDLLKKLQFDYFESKKISEIEYKIKTDRFKEMIRDVDRQIPLLKETLAKLDQSEIVLKKSKK